MTDATAFMTRIVFLSQDLIPGKNPDPARFANTLYDFARPATEALPRPKRRARSFEAGRKIFDKSNRKPEGSHKNFSIPEAPPDDLAFQIYNLKVEMSESLGRRYPSKVSDRSQRSLHTYRRKRHEYFAIFEFRHIENSALARNHAKLNAISYDNVANWAELNEELLRDNIDCMICYKMIFIHESLISTNPTIAFTCASCASTLICSACKMKIKTCPMCKKGSLVHLNSMLLSEIRKMKFRCPLKPLDPIHLPARCSEMEGMTPRRLFQHLSKECPCRSQLNHYSIRIRDLQFCRYYCDIYGKKTNLILEFLPTAVDQTCAFGKFDCKKCIDKHNSTGALMRRQCNRHFQNLTFPESMIRIKGETFRPHLEALKCYICKGLPTIPRVCSKCKTCVLCLQCARDNFIRYNQCPECSFQSPRFVALPLNMNKILSQVEVKCQKCVDQLIVSKGDEEGNNSLSSPYEDPAGHHSEADRMLKILRTRVEPEEIEQEVSWIPYHEYLGHLKICSACPSCSFYCKDCSQNVRYSDRESHQGEACQQQQAISTSLDKLGMIQVANEEQNQEPQKLNWSLYCKQVKFISQTYFYDRYRRFDPELDYQLFYTPLALEALDFLFFLAFLVLGLQIIGTADDGDLPPNWSSTSARSFFQGSFFGFLGLTILCQVLFVVETYCRSTDRRPGISKLSVILLVIMSLTQLWPFFPFFGGGVLYARNMLQQQFIKNVRSSIYFNRWALSLLSLGMASLAILKLDSDDEELGEMEMSLAEKWHLWLLLVYALTIIPVTLIRQTNVRNRDL